MDNLSNEYEPKVNITPKAHHDLYIIVKENKEIRKRAMKARGDIVLINTNY